MAALPRASQSPGAGIALAQGRPTIIVMPASASPSAATRPRVSGSTPPRAMKSATQAG